MKEKSPTNTERKTPLSPIDQASGKKTARADFDRNRDGLYGGLPKTRQPGAPGPKPSKPRPQSNTSVKQK
jgi:hypothetical protein